MTGYGNIAKTKQIGSWVKYVFSLMPEKKLSSCAEPLEWAFELRFTEQIPKILGENSEHFRAFWETLFEKERAKKSHEIYLGPTSLRTILEKRTPPYSLVAPLLGLAKSLYYFILTIFRKKSVIDGFIFHWFPLHENEAKFLVKPHLM